MIFFRCFMIFMHIISEKKYFLIFFVDMCQIQVQVEHNPLGCAKLKKNMFFVNISEKVISASHNIVIFEISVFFYTIYQILTSQGQVLLQLLGDQSPKLVGGGLWWAANGLWRADLDMPPKNRKVMKIDQEGVKMKKYGDIWILHPILPYTLQNFHDRSKTTHVINKRVLSTSGSTPAGSAFCVVRASPNSNLSLIHTHPRPITLKEVDLS